MPSSAVSTTSAPAASPARPVAIWLFVCCAMIFVMVVLGGVTRLTHSGLSIVEWRPLLGWMPPLSDAAWADLFQKYQATPEFRQLNHAMTLQEFKPIFWMEYVHRLWGRLIGVVFLIPFLAFAATGRIERRLWPQFVAVFLLGAFQGALGWYMVKSGLIERPDVSQYRLAAHLGTAFVIYACLLWLALDLFYAGTRDATGAAAQRLWRHALGLGGLIFVTVLAGALVAGLDAGFAYNTFPLMGGRIVPEGALELRPWYLNFFENVATVQFTHRVLAIATFVLVTAFWLKARQRGLRGAAQTAANVFMALTWLQVALGISTLVLVVPVPLAAAHQAGAVALFTAALWTAHRLRAAT
jgi:cytochrome c oxidase assembly protein subunit 15